MPSLAPKLHSHSSYKRYHKRDTQSKLEIGVSSDDTYPAFGRPRLRVTIVEKLMAAPFTVLGWQVSDIAVGVKTLQAKGVSFQRFAGMQQDELGIWMAPSGAKIAWFKDPDGNVLSLSQH